MNSGLGSAFRRTCMPASLGVFFKSQKRCNFVNDHPGKAVANAAMADYTARGEILSNVVDGRGQAAFS